MSTQSFEDPAPHPSSRPHAAAWLAAFAVLLLPQRSDAGENRPVGLGQPPAIRQDPTAGGHSPELRGRILLHEVLQRLPTEPVTMHGVLIKRRPRGIVSARYAITVDLHWGAVPAIARYTVATEDGNVLEQVVARRGETLELMRLSGPRLEPSQPPEWNDAVQGSDLSWLDVTLGFLWWDDPRWIGEDTVRGRLADIVEVTPPAPIPGCARMRLWIDQEARMLLQAEEIDAQGVVQRRMWVRAVRKIEDRWMVRDLEVERRGSGHRTRLHVSDQLVDP